MLSFRGEKRAVYAAVRLADHGVQENATLPIAADKQVTNGQEACGDDPCGVSPAQEDASKAAAAAD